MDTVISPRDLTVYHLSGDGIITGNSDSPYHGDFNLETKIRVSADGNFVFNSSGHVFKAPSLEIHEELKYNFTDVLFYDNAFYLGRNGLLLGHSIEDFEHYDTLSTHGDVQTLLQNKNDIVIVTHFYEDDSTVPITGIEIKKKQGDGSTAPNLQIPYEYNGAITNGF